MRVCVLCVHCVMCECVYLWVAMMYNVTVSTACQPRHPLRHALCIIDGIHDAKEELVFKLPSG